MFAGDCPSCNEVTEKILWNSQQALTPYLAPVKTNQFRQFVYYQLVEA